MADLYGAPEEVEGVVRDAERSVARAGRPLEEVRLGAPCAPATILTIGENYPLPNGSRGARRGPPLVFAKLASAVIGPDDDIPWDPVAYPQLDYEAELAIVIGRTMDRVAVEDALHYVFGYTCVNDAASRDQRFAGDQYILGKSGPGFCPLGPWIVPVAEVPDPQRLRLGSRVNGEIRQDASTSEMRWTVAEILAEVSRFVTLRPGDVVTTGTPHGTGESYDPPLFLQLGDEVVVWVEAVGELRNRVTLRL
ncbi:MAG TPA: fumarylacetoacetate hydrolase family protein [Candidatus Limnocylindrales bacterium]|nr:fumarylacetoacetate hydrolase family protein [Candidatus Limnocylindrales bacterium]